MTTLALRCGALYDGTGRPPRRNVTLLIEGMTVRAIVDGTTAVDALRTIETRAVSPGLINSHVHLEASGDPDFMGVYILKTAAEKTLGAALNARKALNAGVTTVRDLGASDGNAIAVRDAVARGEHVGPTVIPAGRAICMTGGHGFFVGREADGPWDARKAVREQLKAGAECIKLIATGGVLTKGAVPGRDQLSEEEMHAAILECRTHGMRVAAHAIGTSGIKNALRAGVSSIEHGHLLDDEAIALFKERGAYLVPTIAAVTCIFEHIEGGKQPDYVVRKATEIYEKMRVNLRRAYEGGVTFAGGSDAGTPYNYHEKYSYEVELMQTVLGMSAGQALCAATKVAGELLGVTAGVIDIGRPADLLALDGELDDNTFALREPALVVKGGAVAFERGG